MVDQLGDHFSFFSLPESLSLGWFICLAVFGLAYYTNPSEKSFKSFLEKFPIATQRSLPKIDNHSNRGHHIIQRSRSNIHQPQPSKPKAAPRNLKHPSHSLSASSQVSFPPLGHSPYNRHNLLLCTLISVDRTQHLALNISFDHSEDDTYPQLEWFFGCFDTWFALRRQIPPAIVSFPTFSIHETLKTIWSQWTWPIPDLLLPQKPSTYSSLEDLSPLIKPKRKKSQRTQKSHLLQCETSNLCDRSTECSTLEHSFTSPTSGRESDGHSAQQSSPNCASDLFTIPNPSVNLMAHSPRSHESVSMTPKISTPISRISDTNQVSGPVKLADDVVCESPTRSELVSSNLELPLSSGCGQQLNENHFQSSPVNVEKKLQQAETKPHKKDVDERHCPSSLQQSTEPKDSKDTKQAKLDDKQDQSKPSHASITKQSTKVKSEVSHKKCPSINTKSKKDAQQVKKEEEKVKNSTRPNKVEVVKLSKVKDIKVVRKNESKEKLVTRQADSSRKREVNLKQCKPNSNPVIIRKVDGHSPVEDPGMRQAVPTPHHSFGSSSPSPPLDHSANIPTNVLHSIPMTSIPPIPQIPSLMVPAALENFNSSLLLHDASPQYPLADPWAPGAWSEAAQQSHIRDSFISLPNLERSALKDHYPIFRGLDYASPLDSISPLPLTEELFHYQQELNLSSHVTSSSEWVFPPPIQTQTSPFGAIGQQGSATSTQAHSSPVSSSSLFRLPAPPANAPHLIENTFLVRSNSARKDNISRTSSSNSLSQLPGYCSTRSSPSLSPYAPIGTPLHPRHSSLNEVCERPGEALGGVNLEYPLNCRTTDSFDVSVQEANLSEPGLGHCATLRNGVSRSVMPFDPTVSSPVCNPVEGFSPVKAMEKPTCVMTRHQTTQSLNGMPQPATNGLNSIFDDVPDKVFPTPNSSSRPKRNGFSLNPSAKAFAFGGSKTSSIQNSCPPASSVDRQRARGYSQSNIPTSSESVFHKPEHSSNLLSKHQEDQAKSKNALKSLHRSSWSVVLGCKGMVSSAPALKPEPIEISKLKYDESSSNPANRTGVLSELSMLSSSEVVLPVDRSKSACSGLFGSIGDMKAKKTSASSSANISPVAPSSVLEKPFCSSLKVSNT